MGARQLDEFGGAEAFVANLDRMADRKAVDRGGKQVEEGAKVVRIEFLGPGELPVDRPELLLRAP